MVGTNNLSSNISSEMKDIRNIPHDEGESTHRIDRILKGLTFVDSPLIFSGKFANILESKEDQVK